METVLFNCALSDSLEHCNQPAGGVCGKQENASSMTAVEYKAHSRMAWTTSTGMHVSGP